MGKQIIIKGADFSLNGLNVTEILKGSDYIIQDKRISNNAVAASEGAKMVAFPITSEVCLLLKNTVSYPNNVAYLVNSLEIDSPAVLCPGFKTSETEAKARFAVDNREGIYNYVCINVKSASTPTVDITSSVKLYKGFKNKYINTDDVVVYKKKARSTNKIVSNSTRDTICGEAQSNAVMIEILNGNSSIVTISDADVTPSSSDAPAIVTTENTKWILGLDLHKFYQFYSRDANASVPYDYTDELQLRIYCI